MEQKKTIRILMLEDSATDAELIVFELRKAGIVFNTERVQSRENFIKALNVFKPDLILSDYNLPDFDGRDALNIVQQSHLEIPVIMVTGALADIKAADLLEMGAKDYILKDRMSRLGTAVMQALSSEQEFHLRKEAEKAVQVGEMHYQAIMDGANDAIICVNSQDIIYLWNRKAEQLFGYTAKEAIGQNMYPLIVPERAREGLRQYAKNGTGTVGKTLEITAYHRNKYEFPVDISISPMCINGQWHTSAIIRDITERRQNEAKQQQLTAIIEATPDFVGFAKAKDTDVLYINRSGRKMAGIGADEDITRLKIADTHPDWVNQKLHDEIIPAAIRDGFWAGEVAILNRVDGQETPVMMRLMSHKSDSGEVDVFSTICRDITKQKQQQAQMVRLSSAVKQTADAVMITGLNGCIEYVNPAFETITGYSAKEALGCTPNILKSDQQNKDLYALLWQTILAGKSFRDILVNRRKSGALYYEEKTISPIVDENGKMTAFLSTGKDITERMQRHDKYQYLAHHDVLTDLPNRALLYDRLSHSLMHRAREHEILAVLYLDLDNFKEINDTLGHSIGDKLLIDVSERLLQKLRSVDTLARLGGDEFVVVADDLKTVQAVETIIGHVQSAFFEPFQLGSHEVYVSASIGIALCPADGVNSEELLKYADSAMYRAKAQGHGNYHFYTAEMGNQMAERLYLKSALREALLNNQFRLLYQPQVELNTGKIIAVEALIRWQHPERGLISPDLFIPLLEESQQINAVGDWVIRTACQQARAWRDMGLAPIRMAVNFSTIQFRQQKLVESITTILKDNGIEPCFFEVEITESVILENSLQNKAIIEQLDTLGFNITLDDFGTGYSSLSYLRGFPVDTVKIDHSFISELTSNPDDASITEAIISMAHSLKLNVVAEGVETAEQMKFLASRNCDMIQGYFFSKPVTDSEISVLLQSKPFNCNIDQ